MKKVIIFTTIAGILLFAFVSHSYPIILKVVTGSARILSSPIDATIKIDGENEPSARCFAVKSSFNGNPADYLVLWVGNPSAIYGREILIVDRLHDDLGLPNAGDLDYELLGGRLLFQSESGSMYVPFKSTKFDSQDPQIQFSEKYIRFVVPHSPILEGKNIEINLN